MQRKDEIMMNLLTTTNKNLKRLLHQSAHPILRNQRRINNGDHFVHESSRTVNHNGVNDEHLGDEELINENVLVCFPAGLFSCPKKISLWHE